MILIASICFLCICVLLPFCPWRRGCWLYGGQVAHSNLGKHWFHQMVWLLQDSQHKTSVFRFFITRSKLDINKHLLIHYLFYTHTHTQSYALTHLHSQLLCGLGGCAITLWWKTVSLCSGPTGHSRFWEAFDKASILWGHIERKMQIFYSPSNSEIFTLDMFFIWTFPWLVLHECMYVHGCTYTVLVYVSPDDNFVKVSSLHSPCRAQGPNLNN